jgi:hypothetical protein
MEVTKIYLINVCERKKGNSKNFYLLDALNHDSHSRWIAAFKALRFNSTVAALQQNDPTITAATLRYSFSEEFEISAERCKAFCSAIEGNSYVVKFKNNSGCWGIEFETAVSQMLRRNSSLVEVDLSCETIFFSEAGIGFTVDL